MTNKDLIKEFKRISELDDIDFSKGYKYFYSARKHFESVQDGMANENNFFDSTITKFTEVSKPRRKPDYVSGSGSRYWYKKDGVIRGSDHWGNRVANCDWAFKKKDGKTVYGASAWGTKNFTEEKFGFSKWSDFILKSEIIEIEGEEVLTTFKNKVGFNLVKHKGKLYEKTIVVSYNRVHK